MDLVRCRGCNAAVTWALTPNERWMAVCPDADPAGNVIFVGPGQVRVLTNEERAAPAGEPRYRPHFADCQEARRAAHGATPAARARTQERFDEETEAMEEPGGER
jgi:2-methylcitrate dehydratase PrpD